MAVTAFVNVALIHYWLLTNRGGEKVLRAIAKLFPGADLFTLLADEKLTDELFPGHKLYQSALSNLPGVQMYYKTLLPVMPAALESFDLNEYDLIISSEAGPAKGIIPAPNATHICYCHSPMRYLWDQYHIYRDNASWPMRYAMPFITSTLRQWDVTTASRVDHFVANSSYVRNRIKKYYRRDASVVHPPVEIEAFAAPLQDPAKENQFHNRYLWAGQLTAYKRPDLAIEAFNRSGRNLTVIGEGEELRGLRRKAKPNIEFLGKVDFDTLKAAYKGSRALIFPGEEDFGIIPVEAIASGLPVIAYARGGALDTVRPGKTGILFESQTAEGLLSAIEEFEATPSYSESEMLAFAETFNESSFLTKFRAEVDKARSTSA